MDKFYVQSGTLSVVILAEDEWDAIKRSIKLVATTTDTGGDHTLDHHFHVGEKGFESSPEHTFPTEEVLERLNIKLE
jgi:hypothetical protein